MVYYKVALGGVNRASGIWISPLAMRSEGGELGGSPPWEVALELGIQGILVQAINLETILLSVL